MTTRLSLLLPLSSPFFYQGSFSFSVSVSLIFSLPFFVFFFSFRGCHTKKRQQKQQKQKQPKTVVVTFSLSGKIVQNCSTKQQKKEMIFNLEGLTVYFPYEYLYPVRVSTRAQTRTRAFFISLRSLARTLPFVCLLALTRNFPSRHGTNNFFYAGTIPIHD